MESKQGSFGRVLFFLLIFLGILFISSCVRIPSLNTQSLEAKCNSVFGAYVEFCNSRRVLSNQVQDGSLIAIEKSNGRVVKVAAYYDARYTLCLPKTYRRYFYYGEPVKVVVLRCGYSKNKPYCPWRVKYGYASWYGYGDNSGRWTASGRPFKPETFGLANKELPFGTLVRITNLENGRSDYAVVLDRGPYVKGRDFDLYPKTMRALGGIRKGVIPVKVEVIRCGWPVE